MPSKLKWFWIQLRNKPHNPNHYYMDGKWWTPQWSPEDEDAWQWSVFADHSDFAHVQYVRREWLRVNGR